MPPLDDQIEDTNSSDVSDMDDAVQLNESEANGTAAAVSSTAEGEEDAGLLSVVRDVVKESRGEQPDAASPAVGEEGSEAKGSDDEDYSDVPFNRHPRFQKVVKERREFKAQMEALQGQVEPLKLDAERYNNVVGFLDQSGLNADEAADLLTVGGLAKTNPVEAWKRAKSWVQGLLIAAGEVVPDDLQQRVTAGELSREAALDISRLRSQTASMQATQSFQQQREERQRQQAGADGMRQTASDWETDRRVKDPNFAAKLPAIQREIVFLQRTDGMPKDAEGVKAQLMKAYKNVNDSLKAAAPNPAPKTAIRPVTGGQVAGNQRPAEMTTLDIVRANRRAS